jgi:hypothetical protein
VSAGGSNGVGARTVDEEFGGLDVDANHPPQVSRAIRGLATDEDEAARRRRLCPNIGHIWRTVSENRPLDDEIPRSIVCGTHRSRPWYVPREGTGYGQQLRNRMD